MNFSSASISLGLAAFQSRTLNALLTSNDADKNFMSVLTGQLQDMDGTATDSLSAITSSIGGKEVRSAGRNMALFDPESAYRMMSEINTRDVLYKAQFSELKQMGSGLAEMEDAGASLGRMTLSTSDESIKSDLQQFVAQYNRWVQRFDSDLRQGGLLADTQAAQISRYELEQSVTNTFHGARDGLHGLRDLGITIDAGSRLASMDFAKLDSLLASNRQGVVDTVQEFSANFAKSADLLNAADNFMPRQLDNLQRAIQYIADNRTGLQAEFGTGDSARPAGQVARALASYTAMFESPVVQNLGNA